MRQFNSRSNQLKVIQANQDMSIQSNMLFNSTFRYYCLSLRIIAILSQVTMIRRPSAAGRRLSSLKGGFEDSAPSGIIGPRRGSLAERRLSVSRYYFAMIDDALNRR